MTPCRYASAPQELWEQRSKLGVPGWQKVAEPDRFLCSWATFHEESVEKLSNTPPWLQRNALAGHLMRKDDCASCPCYSPGDPVE